ncbi:unnamed protein product [Brugia pahangi]|uniref:Ovule protein n=1 Tax=Brugia pahangi TaxID=6280 RepID=A0A0N4TNE6_BRUPA|nr:unnamed protein product [Brugia pahangi]
MNECKDGRRNGLVVPRFLKFHHSIPNGRWEILLHYISNFLLLYVKKSEVLHRPKHFCIILALKKKILNYNEAISATSLGLLMFTTSINYYSLMQQHDANEA